VEPSVKACGVDAYIGVVILAAVNPPLVFTFVTFSLNSVNPRSTDVVIDPSHSMKLNSFTSNIDESAKEVTPKRDINSYEKYITYATI
jgi:hypothetical protein